MDEFVIRALLGGWGVAAVAGPLGSFVVWRRMSYFGSTLAHSALLGVAFGLMFGIDVNIGVLLLSLAIALGLVLLERQKRLPTDTLLGLVAHSTLAFGMIALAFMQTLRVDLLAYLFGDVLAVRWLDLAWIYGGGAVVLGALMLIWRRLLAITIHEELARVEGIPVTAIHLAFMLLIGVVIAIAMKIVGILLIVSLLIIPPATARRFARSPEQMAVVAALLGFVAVAAGMLGSLYLDIPAGPAIVSAASVLFALAHAVPAGSAAM